MQAISIDPPLPVGSINFETHKYYRLIYEMVKNHPFTRQLSALHGSVIVRGGSILSVGLNNPGRCSLSDHYAYHLGYTKHAELNAIKNVNLRKNPDLSGSVMYNLRLDKMGNIRLSAPCIGCQKLLLDHGIKKCYFSMEGGQIGAWKAADLKENLLRLAA